MKDERGIIPFILHRSKHPSTLMFHALIPAAGHSKRMGQPKLALPLGGRIVLERVVAALKGAGAEVLVVLGPHVANLAGPARAAGARVLSLAEATPDMRATIERGLTLLDEQYHPQPDEPWLLAPADHPALDAALIKQLHEQLLARSDFSIALPTHAGQRGHPALIRWRHLPGIRAFPPAQGLNAYLRRFQQETLELPVESPDMLLDLDTPEDYERLCRRFGE
jgi:molybdenum cofactor cytidylyltransferase